LVLDGSDLGVLGLQRLARCSKACNSAVAELLLSRAASLLPSAVKEAAATEQADSNPTRKEVRVVRLLLFKASRMYTSTSLAAPTAAAQFLSISKMAKVVATELIKAGLRFSFEQLMQAVRARTAGVEVWVKAIADQQPAVKEALQAGLPSWVETLCYTPDTLVRIRQAKVYSG
jgi:hypothetical protein